MGPESPVPAAARLFLWFFVFFSYTAEKEAHYSKNRRSTTTERNSSEMNFCWAERFSNTRVKNLAAVYAEEEKLLVSLLVKTLVINADDPPD